ncbi:hypothetical protein V5T82_15360 [Magnetovibrio sp. PR-2]|uniref:hypothetical protein n=1 Tax=Magnetovibrio sp. PR-2 TaxID=3120356 RepID=UPI002FCE498F
MSETLIRSEILRAVTALAVAEMQRSRGVSLVYAVHESTDALISAGHITETDAPGFWAPHACEAN